MKRMTTFHVDKVPMAKTPESFVWIGEDHVKITMDWTESDKLLEACSSRGGLGATIGAIAISGNRSAI